MSTYQSLPLLEARRAARLAVRDAESDGGPVRVLTVDDHPAVRAALDGILAGESDLVGVGATATARDALAETQRLAPDVVVVDYHLPDEDGLTLTRRLKSLSRPPRVLVFSAYADARLTIAAIVAGADGIAGKGGRGDELCDAIRAVADGRRALPHILPEALNAAATRLDPADVPILSMLVHGTPAAEIAEVLRVSDEWVDARRWAVLERLTRPPRRSSLSAPAPAVAANGSTRQRRAIRVVCADDHPAVRRGIEALLDDAGPIALLGVAADEQELWAALRGSRPDVVLLDVHLPGSDGLVLCRRVKRTLPTPAVLLYSAFADERLRLGARLAGADGLLDKAVPPHELVAALHAVAAGEQVLPALDERELRLLSDELSPEDQLLVGMLLQPSITTREMTRAMSVDDDQLQRQLDRLLARVTQVR